MIHSFLSFARAKGAKLLILLAILCYAPIYKTVAEDLSLDSQTSDALNAVLLIDSSASMLVNDPNQLRTEGAKLLLQFLKSGDKLAIVSFNENAQVLRQLTRFGSDQLPDIQKIFSSLEANGQYTDLNAGLKSAYDLLSKAPSDGAKSVVILISDGKMDPAPERGTVDSHLDELTTRILPAFKMANEKVYTLAFSQDADKALLQHIAQATEGINWFTPNSETIHESFADLFLSLKKPQVVPKSSKGFKIDPNIEEATFYINQPEGVTIEIEDPNEERFSAQNPGEQIKWFDGKKFSVITVVNPQSGEWKLIGVDPDAGFATILTNLKLVTDWPNAIPVDDSVTLRARLYEGKIPVDLDAIAQAVDFAFQVVPNDRVSEPIIREFLVDDGTNGDEKAHDGIFSRKIKISDSGEYKLRVLAKGPTFERQLQIPFRVRPPIVTLSIEEEGSSEHSGAEHEDHAADAKHNEHVESKTPKNKTVEGSQHSIIKISLNEEAATFKDVEVSLVAIDKERNKHNISVKAPKDASDHHSDSLVYSLSAESLPKDGVYELKAELHAKSRDGKKIEEESEVLKFLRKTIIELAQKAVTETPDHHVVVEKEVPVVDKGFDWIALVIVTILNLGLGAGLFFLLKKTKAAAGSSQEFELPVLPAELMSELDNLEKLVTQEEVNFDELGAIEVPAALVASTPAEAATEAVADSQPTE